MGNKKSSNLQSGLEDLYMGKGYHYFVDSVSGNNSYGGRSWRTAMSTLTYALTVVSAHDVIHLSGSFNEAVIVPYALNDLTIIGGDFNSRTARIKYGSGGSPCITVRAERVNLLNLFIEPPSNSSGIAVERTGGSTTYYANNTVIKNCEFWTGKYGVDFGREGSHNVLIENCQFRNMRATGATAIAASVNGQPIRARIKNCLFRGNVNHIVVGLVDSEIVDCQVMDASSQSQSTTLKIDLRNGSDNFVNGCRLGGTYSNAGGYYASGVTDDWTGNFIAGGLTTANP